MPTKKQPVKPTDTNLGVDCDTTGLPDDLVAEAVAIDAAGVDIEADREAANQARRNLGTSADNMTLKAVHGLADSQEKNRVGTVTKTVQHLWVIFAFWPKLLRFFEQRKVDAEAAYEATVEREYKKFEEAGALDAMQGGNSP